MCRREVQVPCHRNNPKAILSLFSSVLQCTEYAIVINPIGAVAVLALDLNQMDPYTFICCISQRCLNHETLMLQVRGNPRRVS